MLARQRQAFILDRVREDGAVRVADLVRELGVSDMTVRRDLEILHERGLLEKVHGGATSIAGNALFEPGFAAKSALQQLEKDALDWEGLDLSPADQATLLDVDRGEWAAEVPEIRAFFGRIGGRLPEAMGQSLDALSGQLTATTV